jgi:hypothetical protein
VSPRVYYCQRIVKSSVDKNIRRWFASGPYCPRPGAMSIRQDLLTTVYTSFVLRELQVVKINKIEHAREVICTSGVTEMYAHNAF